MDPVPPDPRLLEALREDLSTAEFTVDRLRETWGADADAALHRSDRVPALRALRSPAAAADPAAALARLFVLGEPLDADEVRRALPRLGVAGAESLGLAAVAGDRARALVDLRPYGVLDTAGVASWWIVSDPGETRTGRALPEDHVLGVGGASTTLAGLQLPDPAGSVLDLGTGCGIQSLHASRYSRRVVATDLSVRALRLAAITLGLAGLSDTVALRRGDLFEPVDGERFDRIVSNPPFVITPRRPGVPRYDYRDGGAVGDGLLATLIARIPRHLRPGGIAQLLGNWEYRDGGDGLAAVAGWAADAGLEHWIVERDRVDPARYAETWIRDGGTRPGDPDYEALLDAWLGDFAARGVEAIGFGFVLLRAPGSAEPRLALTERLPESLGDNPAGLGEHVSRALAAHDRISGLDDAGLARARLRVAPDVSEERSHRPGAEHPSAIVLRQGGGFGRSIPVDTALAAVVGACDGELALGAIVDAVAELTDEDAGALRARLAPRIRELVVNGILRF